MSGPSGFDFVHESGAVGSLEMPEIMGPGCAIFDADQDGDLDLYLLQGSFAYSDPGHSPAPANVLFLRGADGRYSRAKKSGLEDPGYGMGVAIGDVNGDDLVDVYVTNAGPDRLFLNLGGGKFRDASSEWGVGDPAWGCSVAMFDLEGDGDLDVFVSHYVKYDPAKRCTDAAGRPEYCGPKEFPPLPDLLLRNDGKRFVDASESAGIATTAAAGLGVTCADFDGDGRRDVYVANDAYANNLWVNQGDGTLLDDALLLGAAFNVQGMAEAGMGVLTGDFDNDLDLDLFMTHLRNESNTLYAAEGIGFEDRTAEFGLASLSLPATGFGTVTFDVELDGDLDLVVGNGAVNRGEPRKDSDQPAPWDRYAEPNHLYLMTDGKFGFASAEVGGELTSRVEVTRGLAVGDLDDDGDLDLLLTNTSGPARIYRNDAPRGGHWLRVRPTERAAGSVAIGAIVIVRAAGRSWMRLADPAFSYLSSSDPRVHFGLGNVEAVTSIDVKWPDGTFESFPGGAVDREVALVKGTGQALAAGGSR
ncbi:MAG: CRTAC1 family protein [bacterium]